MDKEPSKSIDLRSDTVTQPCKSMRKAMHLRAEANCVGNRMGPSRVTSCPFLMGMIQLLFDYSKK